MAPAPHELEIFSLVREPADPELLTFPEPTGRPVLCFGGVDNNEDELLTDEDALAPALNPDGDALCFLIRAVPLLTLAAVEGEELEEEAGDPFIGTAGVVLILTPALDSVDEVGFLLIVSLLPLSVALNVVWAGMLFSALREYFNFSPATFGTDPLFPELLSGLLDGPAVVSTFTSAAGGEDADVPSPAETAGFTLLLNLSMTALREPFGFFTAAAAAAAAALDICCCCCCCC